MLHVDYKLQQVIAIVLGTLTVKKRDRYQKPEVPSKNVNHESRYNIKTIGTELRKHAIVACFLTSLLLQNLLCSLSKKCY
jgi:hypothetical protein